MSAAGPMHGSTPQDGRRTAAMARAFVFVSGFGSMAVEIAGIRMLSGHAGHAPYVAASVIGTALLGLAAGAAVGGRKVRDRGTAVLRAGIGTAAFAALWPRFAEATVDAVLAPALGRGAAYALSASLLLFFPLFFFAGAVIPSATAALVRGAGAGRAYGEVGALSSAASIIGTFAAGYLLVDVFGAGPAMAVMAACIALVAVAYSAMTDRAAAAFLLLAFLSFALPTPCDDESRYFCIAVRGADIGGVSMTVLLLDGTPQGAAAEDPSVLVHAYQASFGAGLRYVAGDGRTPRVLSLGGGAWVFPRYAASAFPAAPVSVVEIDPAVTAAVRREVLRGGGPGADIVHDDARRFLGRSAETFDVVAIDVFDGDGVPPHLVTEEFFRLVRSRMPEDGIMMMNVVDSGSRPRVAAGTAVAASRAFEWVGVLELGGTDPVNYVIVAADAAPDPAAWREAAQAVVDGSGAALDADAESLASFATSGDMAARAGERLVFTDDFAPVERLVGRPARR